MARMFTDSVNRKLSGNTERCQEARNAPPAPANAAPIAKACSLAAVVLMPMACAASSSSRIACQAQPMRESRSRRESSTAAPISSRIR